MLQRGGKEAVKAKMQRSVGRMRVLGAFASMAEVRKVREAAEEAERQRMMARWPRGLALWKKALRLLAYERPTLWHVAQRHAGATARPERLAKVADWYERLKEMTPQGVREMRTGFADGAGRRFYDRQGPPPSHRAAPHMHYAREAAGHAEAAARGSLESPVLAALLSPRLVGPGAAASYPKPPAIDPDRVAGGVWSADFSWRRGKTPSAGNDDPDSGGCGAPVVGGQHDLLVHSRPPPTGLTRLTLPMSAVAPHTAKRPPAAEAISQGSAAANHRRPPTCSSSKASAALTRAAAAAGKGLPFGQKLKTYLDMMPADETPPVTRYNPVSASARKVRETSFGAGGVLERTAISARGTATTPDVGPGTYGMPRGAKLATPHARIVGKPPVHSQREPTPAPGDFEPNIVHPPGEGGALSARGAFFARAKTGRDQVATVNVPHGPAQGLLMWEAVEPALVRAGLADKGGGGGGGGAYGGGRRGRAAADAAATPSALPAGGRGDKEDYYRRLAKELGREPPAW